MNRRRSGTLGLAVVLVFLGAQACTGSAKEESAPKPGTADVARAAASAEGADEAREPTAAGAPKLCEHGVPADICTRCNPALVEVFKAKGDWCGGHGVPESQCFKCNPNLTFTAQAAPKEAWCGEHGVPEAKCTKCKPQLIAQFIEAGDFCREHGFPESACPHCHPEVAKAAGMPAPQFPPPGTKVQFASPEIEKKAGIETTRAELRPVADTLEVVGRLEFNQNRLAQLSARGDALVAEVQVDIGDEVKAGQPLVVLASADVGEAQAQLQAARARLEAARAALRREEGLAESGVSPKKAVEEARAAAATAKAEHDSALSALKASGAGGGSGGRYTLTAPFAGVVVSRDVVAGKTVSAGEVLVQVADLSTMWAILDVPEESAAEVKAGQKVTLRFEGSGATREASVSKVASAVDPETRTVRVRVDLPNEDASLKSGLFLRANIEVSDAKGAFLLPRDALQRAEGRDLVFVRAAAGVYEPVAVRRGAERAGQVPVLEGLAPGAEVVTTGAFLLKTEILKDSIGAGCADD